MLGAAVRRTPQSDWYSEWSSRREAEATRNAQDFLLARVPRPLPGTRFYYLHAPENAGLYARAYGTRLLSLENWYADTTLRAYLLPELRPDPYPKLFVYYREPPQSPLLIVPGRIPPPDSIAQRHSDHSLERVRLL